MSRKKRKLRLRKQVLACIPIAIILTFSITVLIINKNKTFTSVIVAESKKDENLVTSLRPEESSVSIYLKNLDNQLINLKKDNMIIYYAQKFKLNISEALRIAHEFTNNYQEEYFLQNHVIGPDWIKEREKTFASEEAGIVYFVRDLYRYPENYGSTIEVIRASEEVTIPKNKIGKTIYVDNGLTYEQYLGQICDMYGVNKELALSISYLETGNLTSNLFEFGNNVGGQRGYDGWMKYPTLEAGIIGHVIALRGMSRNYGIDLNNDSAIVELSAIYVNGHPNNPSYSWVEKVNNIKSSVIKRDLFKLN